MFIFLILLVISIRNTANAKIDVIVNTVRGINDTNVRLKRQITLYGDKVRKFIGEPEEFSQNLDSVKDTFNSFKDFLQNSANTIAAPARAVKSITDSAGNALSYLWGGGDSST